MTSETQPRKYQNYIVVGVVCLLCGISVSLVQYKIPTIMTDIMSTYSMGASGGAWLMSIFTLVGVFLAIPVGILAQKIGAKNVMLIAAGVIVVGSVVGAFAASAGILILSRGIEGVALTMITTCGVIVIEKTVSPERIGSAMGIWGVWGSAGSVIAALITPSLFASLGFMGLWLCYASFAIVTALLLAIIVKVPKIQESPIDKTSDIEVAVHNKPRYREVFTRNMILLFISFISFNIVVLATLSFVPTILQAKGVDQTLSGFISSLPMLLSLIASPVFGMLSDRISWKPLLVISVLFLGPCTFLLYNFTGAVLWIAACAMGLVGLGSMAMMLVALMKLMPRPEVVEIAMGVFITVQGIGQFLGSYLVQLLLGPAFENTLLAGIAIMFCGLIGALCAALIKLPRQKTD